MAGERHRKTFVLFGTYGEGNTGDDIILLAMITGLRRRWPGCRLVILAGDRRRTRVFLERENILLDGMILVYSGRWGFFEPAVPFPHSLGWVLENIRWASRCDLLIIGPGNQLQDVTDPWRLVFFLSRACLTRTLGRPFAFVGIGFWEVRHKISRALLRFIGRRAAFISTRDEGSAQDLIRLGCRPEKTTALADVSFALMELKNGEEEAGR